MFFVDLRHDYSVFYGSGIASELGGYIHIRGETGKIIHSYLLKDKTISISNVPAPVLYSNHLLLWEYRLDVDYADCNQEYKDNKAVIGSVTNDEVEFSESHLLNLPFHLLEMIMKLCEGVEYLNFRSTCKRCHLATPMIQWRDEEALSNYSVVSPWLMEVHEEWGPITFIDPMLGDKYFMKSLQVPICNKDICCSRFGWLLFYTDDSLVFYNPFTRDINKIPWISHLVSYCVSAPPTSPDCMVVGFKLNDIYIHLPAQEPSWYMIPLDLDGFNEFHFPTFYGRDLYVLCNEGELYLSIEDYSFEKDVAETPKGCGANYYLTACDQHLLLVMVEKFGEFVTVFKFNDSTKEWEKIDDLGRHTIYICRTTCLCVEAKIPEMENRIYFKPNRSEDRRITFYSLETCTYEAVNHKTIELKYRPNPHVWVEPSWF